MKLSSFTIKNFKSIGEEGVTVEFSPITLLFGANNSGKSTIIQALHLAHEVICNGNFSPNIVSKGGNALDLGGFHNFVHKHDESKTVFLRFDFEHTGYENTPLLPYYEISEYIEDDTYYIYQFLRQKINKTALEIGISWFSADKKAFISLYRTYHNDSLFVEFNNNPDGYIVKFDGCHKCSNISELVGEIQSDKIDSFQYLIENGFKYPLESLDLHIPHWRDKVWSREIIEDFEGDPSVPVLNAVLSSLILGPGQLAAEQLARFRYIGASRVTIPRLFNSGDVQEDDWAEGKAAWKALAENKTALNKVNAELPKVFGEDFGMTIHQQEIIPKDADTPTVGLPTLLLFRNEKLGIFVSPRDLGHGISQVIPLITAPLALPPPPFLAIEEPEANIHPAWQVELAEFFLRMVKRLPEEAVDDGPPLIILETHSEHIMLRLLRRIRETYDGASRESASSASPNDVAVYFLQKGDAGCTEARRMRINKDAKFQNRWPKGFFNERAKELF